MGGPGRTVHPISLVVTINFFSRFEEETPGKKKSGVTFIS